jgi:hypothetical protein
VLVEHIEPHYSLSVLVLLLVFTVIKLLSVIRLQSIINSTLFIVLPNTFLTIPLLVVEPILDKLILKYPTVATLFIFLVDVLYVEFINGKPVTVNIMTNNIIYSPGDT